MALGFSVAVSILLPISAPENIAAANSVASAAVDTSIMPGRRMTRAPAKPTMVAAMRCSPGLSASQIAASTTVNSGMVNISAFASASGMPAMPYIHATAPT